MSTALTLCAFWGLVAYTLWDPARRAQVLTRSTQTWILDGTGLVVQGLLVPVVLVLPLLVVYARLLPTLAGSLVLSPWTAFLLAFVGVDYLYYWNHRLLHTRRLWPIHRVHHTAEQMDVLVTSRNTLWTSFLIVYLWAGSLMTFLLADPTPYLLGAALTAGLDLARHAPIDLARFRRVERLLGLVMILPRDHALHHADLAEHGNYGANLVWWDKLHGTYLGQRAVPARLGIPCTLSLMRRLLWPFYPSRSEETL